MPYLPGGKGRLAEDLARQPVDRAAVGAAAVAGHHLAHHSADASLARQTAGLDDLVDGAAQLLVVDMNG